MLTCQNCRIDYPEGKKFCRECGGPLISKEDAPTSKKIFPEENLSATVPTKKEVSEPAIYCPTCNLDYPPGKKFCKNCGEPLHPKDVSKPLVGSPTRQPEPPKFRSITPIPSATSGGASQGGTKYCPSCGQEYLSDKSFCKACGIPLASQPTQDLKQIPRPITSPDFRPRVDRASSVIVSAQGNNRRILVTILMIANALALLLLFTFAGYFSYKYFYKNENIFASPGSLDTGSATRGTAQNLPAQPSSQPFPQQQGPGLPSPPLPASPTAEAGIRRVFETIKQANLTENIDLFMSCYSTAFPGYQDKRNNTLKTWQDYDMTKLDFTLSNLTITQNRAEVTVDWQINAFSPGSGQTENFNTKNSVTLLNESGQWKIINLR